MSVFLTLVAVFLVLRPAHAQSPKVLQLPTVVPASPEASALAKYINYPVNYSSGLIDISIPLYEIKVGDLTLPIGLSYHASGIKVNENSGLVGLGWSLNAEPSVSRSVEGFPDERAYLKHVVSPPTTSLNEMHYNERLASGDNTLDEQPDAFYYKLLSGSGKFFISKKLRSSESPKFVTVPYAPVSINTANIVNISNGSAAEITSFSIRDQHGVSYDFTNIEKTTPPDQVVPTLSTCWKATTVTSSVTGRTLSFLYQPGSVETIQTLADVTQIHDSISGSVNNISVPVKSFMGCATSSYPAIPRATECINGDCNYRFWDFSSNLWATVPASGNDCVAPKLDGGTTSQVSTIRLQEISYAGGKVVFEKVTIARHGDCLAKIKIYSDTVLIKQYVFSYEPSGGNATRDRILLTSIDMRDGRGKSIGKYQFSYKAGGLPDYLSKQLDYWGYYNGLSNDYTRSLVPSVTVRTNNSPNNASVTVPIGAASRAPVLSSAQGLTLSAIQYPTGGTTSFSYQLNQYKVNGQLRNAGGLRIASVTHNSAAGTIERTYKYGAGEEGDGILRSSPADKQNFSAEQLDVFYAFSGGQPISLVSRKRTFYSNALTDLFYSGGSPVFYNVVTEYESDGQKSLGKTVYEYRRESEGGYGGHYRVPKTTVVIESETDWTYGQLIEKRVYRGDMAAGGYRLASRNVYVYGSENLDQSIYVAKTYWAKNTYGYPTKDAYYDMYILPGGVQYFPYNKQTGAMVLTSDTTFTYYGVRKTVSTNAYTYDNKVTLSPTRVTTTTSDGVNIVATTKYPHDLILTGAAETGRQRLITDWRVSTVLEETQTKGASVSKSRTDYGVFNGKAQPASIVTNTGPSMADEPRVSFDDYDGNGNLLSASKLSDSKVYYIWGYGKLYPVARVEGILQTAISATIVAAIGTRMFTPLTDYVSVKADVDFLKNQLSTLIADARYKVTLYTYFHGTLSSETDPGGITTYYEYDNSGRLKIARDSDGNILKKYQYNYKTAGNN